MEKSKKKKITKSMRIKQKIQQRARRSNGQKEFLKRAEVERDESRMNKRLDE